MARPAPGGGAVSVTVNGKPLQKRWEIAAMPLARKAELAQEGWLLLKVIGGDPAVAMYRRVWLQG